MMKKMMLSLLLVLCLSGCVKQKTEKEILKITENSNFKYELLTEVTEDIKTKFNIMHGFGVYILVDLNVDPDIDDINVYMLNHPTTYYHVTAYPDHKDGGNYITRIETSDPKLYVFDLKVGKNYSDSEIFEYMTSIGYSQRNDIKATFENEYAKIRVYREESIIVKLVVEVIVTNQTGIIF